MQGTGALRGAAQIRFSRSLLLAQEGGTRMSSATPLPRQGARPTPHRVTSGDTIHHHFYFTNSG